MPSTAFSTSFRKLKRRVRIVQDKSETDNPNLNFFPENYSSWKKKQIDLLFTLKRSRYVLNYRALKFQYIFSIFFQFVKNISKTVIDIAKVRQYSKAKLKNASKWPALIAEKNFQLLKKIEQFFIKNFNCKYLLN